MRYLVVGSRCLSRGMSIITAMQEDFEYGWLNKFGRDRNSGIQLRIDHKG